MQQPIDDTRIQPAGNRPRLPADQPEPEIDILDKNHPAVADAISVLTQGSFDPGLAFRQPEDFTLEKPSGKTIGGKAGDYLLVFKVPEGVELNTDLIDKIKEGGTPSKDYWISIIDAGILHFSYSTATQSEELIGRKGLSYGEGHNVYKAAGLKQKAFIPADNQTKLRSLESAQANDLQNVDPDELVLLDIGGNPYPKNAAQFVKQFKPDPADSHSEVLFARVREKYGV
jgi:hypothetical protein